ncbi:MAG: glutamine synthetase [Myxococcota bacterium]|jgi:glutamine synthetase
MNAYKAEYIWIDGTEPTPLLRSKTKIVPEGQQPPIWGFDGSSTNQAPGEHSDCVLKPVRVVHDPLRGGMAKLVMCEVLTTDMEPHPSNTRARCVELAKRFSRHEPWFGLEQEYTFFQDGRPLGWPEAGFPAPQGPYYCSVGGDSAFGRDIVEDHMDACLKAGLSFCGVNAEVMPGQWEFQIGPIGPVEMGDELTIARWLLMRIAEDSGVIVSFDPKPVLGDWNGAGCHTNFSTVSMRENYRAIEKACQALGERAPLHVENYGSDVASRLTGLHETCAFTEFRYGVSDRGASVRIPWQVAKEGKGYIEDRRPNANCDPYVVCSLVTETCCTALDSML